MEIARFERIAPCAWRIGPTGAMRVPAVIYADEALLAAMDDKVLEQLTNVASLPGIVGNAWAMPDAHWGYGFPIVGVAAFDAEAGGVVSGGGVGFDISCGVRLLTSPLVAAELRAVQRPLAERLYEAVPVGVGSRGSIRLDEAEMDAMLAGGARWAVDHRPELFEGATEAISEVGGFSVDVGGRRAYLLQTAEKGIGWLRLVAEGRAGHGSQVNTDNAVTELAAAVARIGEHRWPLQLTPTVRALLDGVAGLTGLPFDPEDEAGIDRLVEALGPAARFDGAAGEYANLPEGDGWFVVAGVADAASLSSWCMARLAEKLPAGTYRRIGGEPGAAGDRGEPGGVDGVQRDVDPVQPGRSETGRALRQPDPVGGQRDLGPRRQRRRRGDDVLEVRDHQRFATGEPDAGDAEPGHRDPQQPDQLVGRQLLIARQPVQALGRHAIGTAQIAQIGQRHPQIARDPAERVDHRAVGGCGRGGVAYRRHAQRDHRHRTAPTMRPRASSTGTISLPSGISDTGIIFRLATASGMPTIVIAIAIAVVMCPMASHTPATITQMTLPTSAPGRGPGFSTIVRPNGHSA